MNISAQGSAENIRFPYRAFVVYSFILHMIAAFFTFGYHHADEYFQIIEFASYKLGITKASDLPWEFPAQIRPALQPAMVYALSKFMALFGKPDHFTIMFVLRLFSGILGWVSSTVFTLLALRWVNSPVLKKWAFIFLAFIWFLPYIHARFSSESVAGSLFFLGLSCLILFDEYREKQNNGKQFLYIALAGLLFGFTFVIRLQMAFALLGLGLWCIFIGKYKIKHIVVMVGMALIPVAIGVLLDRWFYGEWVNTAWNYYESNVVHGKAASFGTSPWWGYFSFTIDEAIIPFSIFLIACVLYVFVKYPKHILTWAFIPFILGHMLIAHKELRFLFPIVNALPIFFVLALQGVHIVEKVKWRKWIMALFLIMNIPLAIAASLKPAHVAFGLYSFIYDYANAHKTALYSLHGEGDPYNLVMLPLTYPKPERGLMLGKISSVSQLDSIKYDGDLLFYTNGYGMPDTLANNPRLEVIYQNVPRFLYNLNVNHWVERTHVQRVYKVKQ